MYKPPRELIKVSQPANHINVVKTDAASKAGSVNDLIHTGRVTAQTQASVIPWIIRPTQVQYKIQILQNRQSHKKTLVSQEHNE